MPEYSCYLFSRSESTAGVHAVFKSSTQIAGFISHCHPPQFVVAFVVFAFGLCFFLRESHWLAFDRVHQRFAATVLLSFPLPLFYSPAEIVGLKLATLALQSMLSNIDNNGVQSPHRQHNL